MPEPRHSVDFQIKITGADAPNDLMRDVRYVEVEQTVHLPSMFTISLNDNELNWIDSEKLKIGNEVEVLMALGRAEGGSRDSLIKGEITSVEPYFSAKEGTRIVVRGYDKSHRLNRGKKTRTFIKMKDTDMVAQLAGEAGLSPDADETTKVYDHVWQHNQSNWEFLIERANRIGYWVYVKEGKLHFKKTPPNEGEVTLDFGDDLLNFHGKMSAAGKPDKVKVRGWDPASQKTVIGEASGPDKDWLKRGGKGIQKSAGDTAKEAFGQVEYVLVDNPVDNQDVAQAMATGIMNEAEQEFIQGEGTCDGNPGIQPGIVVKMQGLGSNWGGKYYVTRALHRVERGTYNTEFTVCSHHFTLSDLIAPANHNGHKISGPVMAKVTDLNDPDNIGRVKFKMPWLDDEADSDWARVVNPGAGNENGFYWLPEIDDEVMVVFEHGDINSPLVVGGLWSSERKPPVEMVEGGKLNHRGFKTKAGWIMEINDKSGEECFTITSPNESNIFKLDQGNKTVEIESEDKLNIVAQGDVTVESKTGGITIKGTAGKLSLEAMEISVKADTTVNIEGMNGVKVKSVGGNTDMEGMSANIKGITGVKVEAAAMTEIKGTVVMIN